MSKLEKYFHHFFNFSIPLTRGECGVSIIYFFFGYEIDTHRNTACFRKEGRGMRKIRHNSSAKKENSNFFHHEKVSRAQRNTKSSSHTISILSFFFFSSSPPQDERNSWKIHNWGKFLYKSRIIFDIFWLQARWEL